MREGRTGTEYEVAYNDKEVIIKWLSMENETGSVSFLWDSVSCVNTFKRDHVNTDCICLTFETPDGCIEVNEEMKGWNTFIDVIGSYLSGFPPWKNWWTNVATPAFATNHMKLWTKAELSASPN